MKTPLGTLTSPTPTAAEQLARRFYRQDHFSNQAMAERAYFRVLAEWLDRGREVARLSRRLGKARERANSLAAINNDLRRQLAQAKATNAVDPSAQPQESRHRATESSSSSAPEMGAGVPR